MKLYEIKSKLRNNRTVGLLIIAIMTVGLWQVPGGTLALYPFTILGTWFHEMAHGVASIIMGGTFIKLELYPNGSGLAYHSGTLWLGNIGRAIIAAAGPLGPTFAGSLLIISSKSEKTSRIALTALGIIMAASVLIWVRTTFGAVAILILAAIILYIAFKGGDKLQRWSVQILGVQAIVSLYLSLNYLFSPGGNIEETHYLSDTAVISQYLFLPYWFWGLSILAFSIYVIYKSIAWAEQKRQKQTDVEHTNQNES
ncbi:MAG: M50 family metallopeptidase [Candidatus Kapaibacterium sp.]